ncbi:hypothetical protein SOPP22_17830 [Shewanella sp. OPT22]|nr:hypothetical protein SOPP22_17830 [Shewanella sp. OPT22]
MYSNVSTASQSLPDHDYYYHQANIPPNSRYSVHITSPYFVADQSQPLIGQVDAAISAGHRFNLCMFVPIREEQTQEMLSMIRLCELRKIPIVVFAKQSDFGARGICLPDVIRERLDQTEVKYIELQQFSIFSEHQFHDKLNREKIDTLIFAGCNYSEKVRASIVGRKEHSASSYTGREFGASDHRVQVFTSPSLLKEPQFSPDENKLYLSCRIVSNFSTTTLEAEIQKNADLSDDVEQRRFLRALTDNNYTELRNFQSNNPSLVKKCFIDEIQKNNIVVIEQFLKFSKIFGTEKLYKNLREHDSTQLLFAALEKKSVTVINWILSDQPGIRVIDELMPSKARFDENESLKVLVSELRKHGVDVLDIKIRGVNLVEYCIDNGCWESLDDIVLNYRNSAVVNELLYEKFFSGEKIHIPKNIICGAINLVVYSAFLKFQAGDEKRLFLLIDHVISIDSEAAHSFCRLHGYRLVALGIEQNNERIVNWVTNVNWDKTKLGALDEKGCSLLHLAVEKGQTDMALTLLPHCNLDKKNQVGQRPLDGVTQGSSLWEYLDGSDIGNKYLRRQPMPVVQVPQVRNPVAPRPSYVSQYALNGSQVIEPKRPQEIYQPPIEKPSHKVVTADIGDRSFFWDKAKFQEFLTNNGFIEGVTGLDFLFEAAVEQNNYAALAYICTKVQKFEDAPIKKYDNLTYLLIQDDEGRLRRNYPHMLSKPGAYFVTLGKNIRDDFERIEPIRIGKKPFTDDSKIIINGHGPHIAGMKGTQFGRIVDRWLNSVGCKGKTCPRITLVSCNVGEEQAAYNPDNGLIEFHDSFVTELVDFLGAKGRNVRITATSGVVSTMPDGVEICYIEHPVTKEVIKWQGEGCWLSPFYPYRNIRGFKKLTQNNYDASMVKYYEYDVTARKVKSRNKYEDENQHFGLQSLAVHLS